MITDGSVHALEMGTRSSERVSPSLAVEQKRRIRLAMISISAIAVALACTVLVLESSSSTPAPVSGASVCLWCWLLFVCVLQCVSTKIPTCGLVWAMPQRYEEANARARRVTALGKPRSLPAAVGR